MADPNTGDLRVSTAQAKLFSNKTIPDSAATIASICGEDQMPEHPVGIRISGYDAGADGTNRGAFKFGDANAQTDYVADGETLDLPFCDPAKIYVVGAADVTEVNIWIFHTP